MDKTAQDSLAKKPVDMRDRILEHLEALTSAVSLDDLARLSTSDIAETLIISRSLASQYLNDLVRAGLVVKVAGRPVRYFHRRAFQKRFQVKLSASEYASLADLIQATGIADHRDFARAVGFDLSLSSVVEQCKAAVQYPPFGLPILLSGGVGVGKSFLSRLVYEYGKNQGLLSRDSSYLRIDCTGVPDAASFNPPRSMDFLTSRSRNRAGAWSLSTASRHSLPLRWSTALRRPSGSMPPRMRRALASFFRRRFPPMI